VGQLHEILYRLNIITLYRKLKKYGLETA